mgnify:CR=1 FL=1
MQRAEIIPIVRNALPIVGSEAFFLLPPSLPADTAAKDDDKGIVR